MEGLGTPNRDVYCCVFSLDTSDKTQVATQPLFLTIKLGGNLNTTVLRREWFSNVRGDILAGAVVALALIPEAIAFSIIAGVDPKVGLYASFSMAVVTAIVGGRPGLISAATGAMALLMIHLVKDHGLQYLFAATILTGILQIICGWLKLGRQMKYVPRAVMVGFVNALAILIFMAQLPQLTNASWQVYVMVAVALAIIYLLPRITKGVPSPLVAIVLLTAASIFMGIFWVTEVKTQSLPLGILGQIWSALFVPAISRVWLPLANSSRLSGCYWRMTAVTVAKNYCNFWWNHLPLRV